MVPAERGNVLSPSAPPPPRSLSMGAISTISWSSVTFEVGSLMHVITTCAGCSFNEHCLPRFVFQIEHARFHEMSFVLSIEHHRLTSDKKCQKKVPKKIHKAEREKLKRDQLNDLFEADRQSNGKACILTDTTRILRDLLFQVEFLRQENSTLQNESHYLQWRGMSCRMRMVCSATHFGAPKRVADAIGRQSRLGPWHY